MFYKAPCGCIHRLQPPAAISASHCLCDALAVCLVPPSDFSNLQEVPHDFDRRDLPSPLGMYPQGCGACHCTFSIHPTESNLHAGITILVPTCYELPRTSLCIDRETYADLMWTSIIHQRYPRQPLARAGLALSDRGGAVRKACP